MSESSTPRQVLFAVVNVLALVVAVAAVLSVFQNTDSRFLKMLDFPRIQLFWASVVGLALLPLTERRLSRREVPTMLALTAGLFIQVYYLLPYTTIHGEAVPDLSAEVSADERFELLMINVRMDNRDAAPILDYVRERRPEVFLAMETDAYWDEQLAELEADYPYAKEAINDEAYGMVLYSELPLREVEVHYRQNANVPSFSAVARLPSGREFDLHTVHPVPPKRFEEYPDNKNEKEVELLLVGEAVAQSTRPAVVIGDFNDVAWSATDRLTGTDDVLRDVRVGRGFYNSFDANSVLLRWPLDHVFVTDGWAVGAFGRGPDVGSDHFPVYAELGFAGS